MSSPVIGDEAGIPVVANAVLGTPNRESISKASSRTRADWSVAVFMIKRPVLQTGVHVGRLSQAWPNRGVSHPSKCFQPGQDSTWRADLWLWASPISAPAQYLRRRRVERHALLWVQEYLQIWWFVRRRP